MLRLIRWPWFTRAEPTPATLDPWEAYTFPERHEIALRRAAHRPVKDVQARLTAKVHDALAGKPAPA